MNTRNISCAMAVWDTRLREPREWTWWCGTLAGRSHRRKLTAVTRKSAKTKPYVAVATFGTEGLADFISAVFSADTPAEMMRKIIAEIVEIHRDSMSGEGSIQLELEAWSHERVAFLRAWDELGGGGVMREPARSTTGS